MFVSFNGNFLADVKRLDSRIIHNIIKFEENLRTLILKHIFLRFINPLIFVNFLESFMG